MSDRLNGKNMPIQMLLMRSGHLLKYQMFSLLEQYDMNPGQVGVLFILERYGNLSQRQLARIAGHFAAVHDGGAAQDGGEGPDRKNAGCG